MTLNDSNYLQKLKGNKECIYFINEDTKFIIEDSNSGFQFFEKFAKSYKKKCRHSNGNSNIYKKIKDGDLCFVVGAAFGAYIDKLSKDMYYKKNSNVYLPESFEWLMLKALVLNKKNKIIEYLNEGNIDSSKYLSYKKYYYELLKKHILNIGGN